MAVGASRASLDKNAYNSGRTLGITWLRSGNNANTNNANGLTPSGGNSNNGVNGWLSGSQVYTKRSPLNYKRFSSEARDAPTASY
mgnify:CR=1 FL=1